MLTKNEIQEKKAKSEQLSLVEKTSPPENNRQKRFLLFVSLFATIGLSFIFWSYRQFYHLIVNPPQISFSLPRLELPRRPDNLDQQITQLIGNDPHRWNVTLYLPATDKSISWSQNNHSFDPPSIFSRLSALKNSSVFTASVLPQGLTIKEEYQETPQKIDSYTLINTPSKPILILASIEGTEPLAAKNLLLQLVSTIYWQAIKE